MIRSVVALAGHRKLLAGIGLGSSLLLTAHLGWMQGPRTWAEATGWEKVPEDGRAPFKSWMPSMGGDFNLHWLGHAGFRLEWGGQVVVVDPNLSPRCLPARRILRVPPGGHAVGPVDVALISHAHFDHLDLPTLRALAPQRVWVPRGARSFVEGATVGGEVRELEIMHTVELGSLRITAVPAAHNGHRLHPFAADAEAVGYVIEHGDKALYIAGDTGFANDWQEIRRRFAPDMAVLPIGAFSPRRPLATYHLSPEEAVQVGLALGVDAVWPSHFGTFVLSLDQPHEALPRFAHEAAAQGLSWYVPVLWPGVQETGAEGLAS